MRFLGYCLRIGAFLAITAAGGGLMALGGIALYNAYLLKQYLDQPSGPDGQAFGEWLAQEGGGPAIDMTATWTPWLIISGELFFGLVLVILGLWGLLRRMARGLPPPAEPAATTEGRIGHALAFGAGTILGLMLLVSALTNNAEQLIPKLMGETASAVVVGSRTDQDRQRYYNYLTYQFQTADGNLVRVETEVPSRFLRKYGQGTKIEVRYMPDDPEHNMLPGVMSYTEFTVRLGIYAFLVVAGIAGVRRNLNYAG